MRGWRLAKRRCGKPASHSPGPDARTVRSAGVSPSRVPAAAGTNEASKMPESVDAEIKRRRRIEELFQEAEKDRSKVNELKAELDRCGMFKEYEDRFLGLFRKGNQ